MNISTRQNVAIASATLRIRQATASRQLRQEIGGSMSRLSMKIKKPTTTNHISSPRPIKSMEMERIKK